MSANRPTCNLLLYGLDLVVTSNATTTYSMYHAISQDIAHIRKLINSVNQCMAWFGLLFIGLFISCVKISRYCYKSDILSCIYSQNEWIMHRLCNLGGIPYPPTGEIGWHNGAGVTHFGTDKLKKEGLPLATCIIKNLWYDITEVKIWDRSENTFQKNGLGSDTGISR